MNRRDKSATNSTSREFSMSYRYSGSIQAPSIEEHNRTTNRKGNGS